MQEEQLDARKNIESLAKVARNIGSQVRPELRVYLDKIVDEVFRAEHHFIVQRI